MTLAEWKRKLHVGQRLVCVYRWYWGKGKPAPPDGREEIVVSEVRTTQLIYSTAKDPRVWMQFPKASELKADEKGFELYFPKTPGQERYYSETQSQLMSRYEWGQE